MDNIKLGDLYLSKSELDYIVQLVQKHIKDYQNKSNDYVIVYIKSLKNNQKIKKE